MGSTDRTRGESTLKATLVGDMRCWPRARFQCFGRTDYKKRTAREATYSTYRQQNDTLHVWYQNAAKPMVTFPFIYLYLYSTRFA